MDVNVSSSGERVCLSKVYHRSIEIAVVDIDRYIARSYRFSMEHVYHCNQRG